MFQMSQFYSPARYHSAKPFRELLIGGRRHGQLESIPPREDEKAAGKRFGPIMEVHKIQLERSEAEDDKESCRHGYHRPHNTAVLPDRSEEGKRRHGET